VHVYKCKLFAYKNKYCIIMPSQKKAYKYLLSLAWNLKLFCQCMTLTRFSPFKTFFFSILTKEVIFKISDVSLQKLYLYLTIVSGYKTLFSSHNLKTMLYLITTKLSISSYSMLEDTILTHIKNHIQRLHVQILSVTYKCLPSQSCLCLLPQ
jgi:hypothetical protein